MQNMVRRAYYGLLGVCGVDYVLEALGWRIVAVDIAAAIASAGVLFETFRYTRWMRRALIKIEDHEGEGRG